MNARDIRFAQPKMPRAQQVLFPNFLDEVVSATAPVRIFAGILDELDWSEWEKAYAGCGQPPIHPRYLAGAILYGLLNRERSSRELERAARKDLDFIWLLEGFTPDHSTFAEFRTCHAEAIGKLQAEFARKLVKRKEKALLHLITDGTRLRADSDRQGARKASTLEYIIGELTRRMEELERMDGGTPERPQEETAWIEGLAPEETPETAPAPADSGESARLAKKRAKYQKALDVAKKRDEVARARNGAKAKPTRVPVTDPDSQVAPNKEGGYAPNYTPVVTVEASTGAIVHADVVEGSHEASAVLPAVEAAESLLGRPVQAVLADGGFATGPVLSALDERGIEAFMPTRSASPADNPALRPDLSIPVAEEDRKRLPRTGGRLSRLAFVYDRASDRYHCPMGEEVLPYRRSTYKGNAQVQYECTACAGCPMAADCLSKGRDRRNITRDEHEPLREAADARMATPEGKALYKTRAPGIETVFGIIKAAMGIRRFTVRGLEKVRTEWTWICTAYNIKKLLALEVEIRRATPKMGTGAPQTVQIVDLRHRHPAWSASCARNRPCHTPRKTARPHKVLLAAA